MIDQSFFGKEGITLTSANHLCNLAKEYLESHRANIDNLKFVNETFSYPGINAVQTTVGINHLPDVIDDVETIAKYHAFIAYMREAIKAKNELLMDKPIFSCFQTEHYPELEEPYRPETITFDDIFAKKSIKEKNTYYRLEALCSALGKTIHPGRPFHDARKALYDAISKPSKMVNGGIATAKPTVKPKEVDAIFFELQKKHRAAEAQLNAIKHAIELEVEEINNRNEENYRTAYKNYAAQLQIAQSEYRSAVEKHREEVQALKIVVPNDLKETYEFLSNL